MVLMDETIPANLFEKELGISRSAVTRLRKGEREFKNFTIDTAEKIQRWLEEAAKIRREAEIEYGYKQEP